MINYKGFIGDVEFDSDAHIFSGRVINTRTVITFSGTIAIEIENEFKASVDDYIEWCKEEGIEPEKPYSGKINVRFSPDLHQMAAIGARRQGMSFNRFMEKAVESELMRIS